MLKWFGYFERMSYETKSKNIYEARGSGWETSLEIREHSIDDGGEKLCKKYKDLLEGIYEEVDVSGRVGV